MNIMGNGKVPKKMGKFAWKKNILQRWLYVDVFSQQWSLMQYAFGFVETIH